MDIWVFYLELLLCYKLLQESFYLYIIHQILIQHILVFSFLLEKSIMDGVYVIFILVEHHLSFFFYFYILEELCFMVHTIMKLTFANTLLLTNAAVSLGGAFVSLEISSSFLIFFSLFSFILAWTFISLQIKEFSIMGLSINDSVYSCLFFFLTGLHFFHLLLGVVLQGLFFWGCSFSVKKMRFVNLRVSEVHLFYNLQLFYWHFLEILWLFIFLVLYLY